MYRGHVSDSGIHMTARRSLARANRGTWWQSAGTEGRNVLQVSAGVRAVGACWTRNTASRSSDPALVTIDRAFTSLTFVR